MPRRLLNADEIRSLVALMRDLFDHQNNLRMTNQLAALIQFPKIPPVLSESIALHLFSTGVLIGRLADGVTVSGSTSGGDIVINSRGTPVKVEVKATAGSAFQHFGDKDIKADILAWLHFGAVFQDRTQEVFTAYLLVKPQKYFAQAGRITLRRFLGVAGADVVSVDVNIHSLEALRTP
jgi:hypothetical protein